MFSAKTSFAFVMVIAVYFSAVQAFGSEKCKFNPERLTADDKKHVTECFLEIAGKPFNPATYKPDSLSGDDKEKICSCTSAKAGVIDAAGNFHADVVEVQFGKMDTSEETKHEMHSAIDKCVETGGDGMTVWKCVKDASIKICGF